MRRTPRKGNASFESAGQTLATEKFDQAGRQQLEGIAALRDARERLDLRPDPDVDQIILVGP